MVFMDYLCLLNEFICVLSDALTWTNHFAISLPKLSVLAPVKVIVFSTILNPLTKKVEKPIKPPRDNTAIAKTSGGVRQMILRESLGSDLIFLMIFIFKTIYAGIFLTAEPKER